MDLSNADWFTSTFTSPATCVEVAFLDDGNVGVRDTKDRSKAPHVYGPAEWKAFINGAKAGEFDLP
jgi:hypothetical protein